MLPWSPLARGLLTGNRTSDLKGQTIRSTSDEFIGKLYESSDMAIVDRVTGLAQQRGVSPAQVALAWLLHQDGVVSPVVGATKLQHLEEAVAAVELELDEDERASLEELYVPHAVSGH